MSDHEWRPAPGNKICLYRLLLYEETKFRMHIRLILWLRWYRKGMYKVYLAADVAIKHHHIIHATTIAEAKVVAMAQLRLKGYDLDSE